LNPNPWTPGFSSGSGVPAGRICARGVRVEQEPEE
jgi:hypothetical protein